MWGLSENFLKRFLHSDLHLPAPVYGIGEYFVGENDVSAHVSDSPLVQL